MIMNMRWSKANRMELQAETDGFEASTFKMQVKTLDFGAAYRDTSLLQGAATNLWQAKAQQSLIYKLSATVSDPRPGHTGLLTLSDTILIRAVYACDASTIPDTLGTIILVTSNRQPTMWSMCLMAQRWNIMPR